MTIDNPSNTNKVTIIKESAVVIPDEHLNAYPVLNPFRDFDYSSLNKKPKKAKPQPVSSEWKERYEMAYRDWFRMKYPAAFKDHGYHDTTWPRVSTANGLTKAIVNYINWNGYRATRISTSGRMINGKYIPGATRRGTADISATIKGKAVMIEIKAGNDRPSEQQIREQAKEMAAGGIYVFIKTMDEFYHLYDNVLNP